MRTTLTLTVLMLAIFGLLCFSGPSSEAKVAPSPVPPPTPVPVLNGIKIGSCSTSGTIDQELEGERTRGLVLDARPFAINQTSGKLSFNGSTGRVTVANMNPFVYNYQISVAQQELISTAVTDFFKLLFPDSLNKVGILQSGNVPAAKVNPTDRLSFIEARLDPLPSDCTAPAANKTDACEALASMRTDYVAIKANLRMAILTSINSPTINVRGVAQPAKPQFETYARSLIRLRDEESDAATTCSTATNLNSDLSNYDFAGFFQQIDTVQKKISETAAQLNDLDALTKAYTADTALKAVTIRCKGFDCNNQFAAYFDAANEVLGGYQRELDDIRSLAEDMRRMYLLTEAMKQKDGLFGRTFTIMKKYELSQATVSVSRLPLRADTNSTNAGNTNKLQSGKEPASSVTNPRPLAEGGESSDGNGPATANQNDAGGGALQSGSTPANPNPPAGTGNNLAPKGQINESIQIGRPKFVLSGGLVYSPLPRQTYKSVKGFTRDAQGNPTGDGSANIVGFDENSSRRLVPMALLNTRLTGIGSNSLYFSVGVSAKHDDNVDIDYLFGPSIGLMNDRALVTFGAYGSNTQKLVGDVRLGDAIPGDVGDAKLFRKGYTGNRGSRLAIAYPAQSPVRRRLPEASRGGSDTSLRNEIRIGKIPFSLSVGFAYTTLEQRTYDEVIGFARNRAGSLTNGQTLARIVGLTSSSNYRLTPLALLHSRLTDFGNGYDIYFSTGITGKKTDNTFDVEYLIGGSVNLQRKVFLTFGTFAGKQQILGGDFFEGAKLNTSQNVTVQNRYVWKPAFAISYDITRIVPRP